MLELGPINTRFASPIMLEIPYCAYMLQRNREIIVLRSENGETWKEHMLDATEQAVQDTIRCYFGACLFHKTIVDSTGIVNANLLGLFLPSPFFRLALFFGGIEATLHTPYLDVRFPPVFRAHLTRSSGIDLHRSRRWDTVLVHRTADPGAIPTGCIAEKDSCWSASAPDRGATGATPVWFARFRLPDRHHRTASA